MDVALVHFRVSLPTSGLKLSRSTVSLNQDQSSSIINESCSDTVNSCLEKKLLTERENKGLELLPENLLLVGWAFGEDIEDTWLPAVLQAKHTFEKKINELIATNEAVVPWY